MSLKIEDYALIGDCHTAALVGRNGSIDWLCLPRFDSPACFAALLGTPEHGRWLLCPAADAERSTRRYREETLILETDYEDGAGAVTVVDCMPPRSDGPVLVRMVVGRRGRMKMKMQLVIRFDYGSIVPWVRRMERGLSAVAGPDSLLLHTDIPLHGEGYTTCAEFSVAEGQCVPLVLRWHPYHQQQPAPIDAQQTVRDTQRWWEKWSRQCSYRGPWRDAVVRSLITLKALTYAPTGGMVASATTSLPEKPGGIRNWDYRFCWVRDATFTLHALINAGYMEEAKAWREWLLLAVAGTPSQLNILYGLAGERRLSEWEIDWLPGYEASRPVRAGNDAWKQFQLDVYGEVMDTFDMARRAGLHPDENAWNVQRAMLEHLESVWQNPDDGIWEVRGPQRHFTHSKIMAWVAMDRAIKAVERYHLDGPIERWRALRKTIHDDVCEKGYDRRTNTFVRYYGSQALDGGLLMAPLVGFLPADDPRIRGTVEAIQRELTHDGFVMRYAHDPTVDGLPHDEGAFLACSFWLADCLLLLGQREEAEQVFERLLGVRNDLGLLAEEYDPQMGRLVGNFPQALSHLSLVNTACNFGRTQQSSRDQAEV